MCSTSNPQFEQTESPRATLFVGFAPRASFGVQHHAGVRALSADLLTRTARARKDLCSILSGCPNEADFEMPRLKKPAAFFMNFLAMGRQE
jgi:hypothetical protein